MCVIDEHKETQKEEVRGLEETVVSGTWPVWKVLRGRVVSFNSDFGVSCV